ncbi:hypothetical protein JXJ21_08985 [candidate division KSB1 bacterium]|nr:hypothetical protein [candidate division KSB1 bacterium]
MKSLFKFFMMLLLFHSISLLNCYSIKFKSKLVANNLVYPVSMTEYIHNNRLKIVNRNGYDKIDHFSIKFRRYYFPFGIGISSEKNDISDKINSLVAKKGGDGVVNFALFHNTKYGAKYHYCAPLPYMIILVQLGTPCYFLYTSKIRGVSSNFFGYLAGIWATTLTIEYLFPKVYTIDAVGDIIKFK